MVLTFVLSYSFCRSVEYNKKGNWTIFIYFYMVYVGKIVKQYKGCTM